MDWNKPCYYNVAQKTRFHREAKVRLKALAELLHLDTNDYDLRQNKAGSAVSGEITLHTDHLYVQVTQTGGDNLNAILVRTCKGREDYTGGPNNFVPLAWLDQLPRLAERCRAVMKALETKKEKV